MYEFEIDRKENTTRRSNVGIFSQLAMYMSDSSGALL